LTKSEFDNYAPDGFIWMFGQHNGAYFINFGDGWAGRCQKICWIDMEWHSTEIQHSQNIM